MSVVNPNKHWEVQSYGMIINKGEIMVNREKLETIVYVFEGKFYVELWDNGYLLHFQEMLGDWNIINSRRGTTMKLKKEHIAFLNETARIDFDSALQMVDGVNMLAEVEYGFVHMNDGDYRLVYWEDGILKDAYKNCEG